MLHFGLMFVAAVSLMTAHLLIMETFGGPNSRRNRDR